jgi:molybdopterin adenylyltransferase
MRQDKTIPVTKTTVSWRKVDGMPSVIAVCTSRKKGTKKKAVATVCLKEGYGITGDAHADARTHRQVSLLAVESIDKMRKLGLELQPGDFAENLTCEGINLCSLPVGTRISVGKDTLLEVTQIGKECHQRCAIYQQVGQCIMPHEGIFARVLKGGMVKAGDIIEVVPK